MTSEEKIKLYNKQKELLDLFLEKGAIEKQQYDVSLSKLMQEFGVSESGEIK